MFSFGGAFFWQDVNCTESRTACNYLHHHWHPFLQLPTNCCTQPNPTNIIKSPCSLNAVPLPDYVNEMCHTCTKTPADFSNLITRKCDRPNFPIPTLCNFTLLPRWKFRSLCSDSFCSWGIVLVVVAFSGWRCGAQMMKRDKKGLESAGIRTITCWSLKFRSNM